MFYYDPEEGDLVTLDGDSEKIYKICSVENVYGMTHAELAPIDNLNARTGASFERLNPICGNDTLEKLNSEYLAQMKNIMENE